MKPQILESLSEEQLNSYLSTLKKRVMDLRDFNLQLGRESVGLSQVYHELSGQKKQRYIEEQMKKSQFSLGKLVSMSKDAIAGMFKQGQLINEPVQTALPRPPLPPQLNGFNFDDIYYKSKDVVVKTVEKVKRRKIFQNYASKAETSPFQPEAIANEEQWEERGEEKKEEQEQMGQNEQQEQFKVEFISETKNSEGNELPNLEIGEKKNPLVEQSGQTHSNQMELPQVQIIGEPCIEQPKEKPTVISNEDIPGDIPGDNPGDIPGDIPGDNPGDIPGDNPGDILEGEL